MRARGELWWGADAQGGAPYVFQDPMDPNRLIGFEVDLADALAAKLGVRARPVLGPWDSLSRPWSVPTLGPSAFQPAPALLPGAGAHTGRAPVAVATVSPRTQ